VAVGIVGVGGGSPACFVVQRLSLIHASVLAVLPACLPASVPLASHLVADVAQRIIAAALQLLLDRNNH